MQRLARNPYPELEEKIRRLDSGNKKIESYFSIDHLRAWSFPEWPQFAVMKPDPDYLRNALYYGFQPLFDALVEERVRDGIRPNALRLYQQLCATTRTYITSYYEGCPQVDRAIADIEALQPMFESIEEVGYRAKDRNIDRNQIFAPDISKFLSRYLAHVMAKKIQKPNYIIGCACGSSEVAFAVAGLFGIEADFIRMSKRRYDSEPIAIEEQQGRIQNGIKNANVACVEDYVCSGQSLSSVLNYVEARGPSSTIGLSIRDSNDADCIKRVIKEERFHAYTNY